MSLNLNETRRAENKIVRPSDPLWDWDIVRTWLRFVGGVSVNPKWL